MLNSAPRRLRPRPHLLGPAVALLLTLPAQGGGQDRQVIGWIERVAVSTEAVVMEAKVDTGADFSSVHAEDIRYIDREGESWVEFSLQAHDGRRVVLQRPVQRIARIKMKTAGFQQRPVVELELCVGDARRRSPVNLAQRGHFQYPLLLGRNFLEAGYLVDVSARYLLPPNCP